MSSLPGSPLSLSFDNSPNLWWHFSAGHKVVTISMKWCGGAGGRPGIFILLCSKVNLMEVRVFSLSFNRDFTWTLLAQKTQKSRIEKHSLNGMNHAKRAIWAQLTNSSARSSILPPHHPNPSSPGAAGDCHHFPASVLHTANWFLAQAWASTSLNAWHSRLPCAQGQSPSFCGGVRLPDSHCPWAESMWVSGFPLTSQSMCLLGHVLKK